ncbi:MAG: recombinase RecA [Christensenellaceae bacterium]|nr:recombinase RecA [Christensenellaceae bacterium]
MAASDKKKGMNIIDRNGDAEQIRAEKAKALDIALAQIEKNFGKGAVMRLGDAANKDGLEVIPSGCLELDIALGVGGYPRGRIIEIYGPESSGKTTFALHAVAEAQKLGGACAFVDAEHAPDPVYAKNLGVDIDNLFVSQPDTGEQGLAIAETLVRSSAIDVLVVDSVAALVPRSEIEGEMGDSSMGVQARMMSQAMRKLAGIIAKSSTVVIFINQLREKIGVMFGNPETTTGGKALKFYASVRLDVRKGEAIKNGDEIIGNKTRVKVVKNKVAPPFKTAECELLYGKGVSFSASLLNVGVEFDIISKMGSWYSYGDTRIGQGAVNARKYIEENPEIGEEIRRKVMAKLGRAEALPEEEESVKSLIED